MNIKNIKADNENGEIMLEAAIILVPVLILLMVMLSLSFMFYQQAMVVSVSNEIASDIGKNYKFTKSEINSGTLDKDHIESMYRMSFAKNSIEGDHQDRAEKYVDWMIPLRSLGLNPDDPTVDCELITSGIGRIYVKVTVTQKTEFFLSSILDMVGLADESTEFSSVTYAECTDLMAYTSLVNFTTYTSSKFGGPTGASAFANLYDSLKGLIDVLMN